jgi:hypothetical protein
MKMKSLLLVTLATLGLTSATIAQVPINGLTSYWLFTGNANDNSGNGHNGTVTGASLTIDRFGNTNCAYNFNGTAQYITTSFSGIVGTNDRTFSLWFKQSESNNGANQWPLFFYGGGTQGSGFSANIFPSNIPSQGNKLGVDIGNSYVVFDPIPSLNEWHHLTLSYSASFGNDVTACRVYLDNVLLTNIAGQYNSNILINTGTAAPNFTIGGNPDFPLGQFLGAIDDFRVYNTTLNQSEISSLYNEGICYTNITVTDTLIINTNITGFNPITYQNTIKVFPNPANDHITIDYGNFATMNGYQLKIENSLGQQLFQTNITQQTDYLSLNNWGGNGLYFVHIIDAQGNTIDIRKIVLQ